MSSRDMSLDKSMDRKSRDRLEKIDEFNSNTTKDVFAHLRAKD